MKRIIGLSIAGLLITGGLLTVTTSIATASTCTKAAPTTAVGYQKLFDIHTAQWSGADGSYSVKLPNGKVLWIFSDTFVGKLDSEGKRTSAKLVNNTAIVQDKGCVTVLGASGTAKQSWIRSGTADGSYYWPTGSVLEGGKLTLLLQHMTPGGEAGFTYAGLDLAIVDVSGTTPVVKSVRKSPVSTVGSTGISWGANVVRGGAYTYVYGTKMPGTLDKVAYVARMPLSGLAIAKTWQFWNGTRWVANPASAAPITTPAQGISSSFSVQYADGKYTIINKKYDFMTNTIERFTSTSPAGPFVNTKLVDVSNPASQYASAIGYVALAHPEAKLASGKTLVTYNVNTFSMTDNMKYGRLYGPRFIEVS